MTTASNKSYIIELSEKQVRATMDRFVEDLIQDFPDEALREEVLHGRLQSHERVWIRRDLMPRVPDHIDISWLAENDIPIAVKSSLQQFLGGVIRIQVLNSAAKKRWDVWRDN